MRLFLLPILVFISVFDMSSDVLFNAQHCLWKIIDVQDDTFFQREFILSSNKQL